MSHDLHAEVQLDEKTFKSQYVANFVATWTANNYDDACMMGQHERLNRPPIEDALFLANAAWAHYMDIYNPKLNIL